MKKYLLVFAVLSALLFACGDPEQKGNKTASGSGTAADSLMDDVNQDHNIGMAKMGKLTRAAQATERLLDSIAKLPAKARVAAQPLQAKLDSLKKELNYAETAMDKWMKEFDWDSSFADINDKVNYLKEEKLKVSKVKEAILNGIQKADTLLQSKF